MDAGADTAVGSWARVPRRGKCGGIGRVPEVPASGGKRVSQTDPGVGVRDTGSAPY